MALSSERSNLIPLFNGTDYPSWKVRMRTYLMSEGLWSVVVNGYIEPEDETNDEKDLGAVRILNAKALTCLQSGVGPTVFPRIIRALSAKDAWDILSSEFEGDARTVRVKLQNLRRQFENFRMVGSDTIQVFYEKLIAIVNNMRTLGEDVSDSRIVHKMLVSLPERYDIVVAVIVESKDLSSLQPEELTGSLAAHDNRLLRRGDKQFESLESAFKARLHIADDSKHSKSSFHQGSGTTNIEGRMEVLENEVSGLRSTVASLQEDLNEMKACLYAIGSLLQKDTAEKGKGKVEGDSSSSTPDRYAVSAAFDQSSGLDRNLSYSNRNIRNQDRSFERSIATSPPPAQPSAFTQNVPSEKVLREERLRCMSIAAIKEFYSAQDEKEAAQCIKDLNSLSFYPSMVSLWVTDSFERKDMERDLLAKLLVNLTKPRVAVLSQGQLVKGFALVLTTLEDAVIDAPKAPEYLGRLFARFILESLISSREIVSLLLGCGGEPGQLLEVGLAGDVLASTLEIIKSEKGEKVPEMKLLSTPICDRIISSPQSLTYQGH